MKHATAISIFLLFFFETFAQQKLTGRIVDATTNAPIVSASVYLSNTSIGTVSNDSGEFLINRIPSGKYDLVVSCIGYETYIQTLESNKLAFLNIKLKQRIKELKEVVVESFDKNGWQKYGNFFLESFIGKSGNADNCKILNKDVIKFNYSSSKNLLKAFTTEPIIIQNKALGYNLKYDLQLFTYNYTTHILYFEGYPFFQEMESNKVHKQKRWLQKRDEAFYGSMMHFMRALFRNKLAENKFEVRKIVEQKNMNILIDKLLPGDSIAYALDSVTVSLEFKGKLDIVYKGKRMIYNDSHSSIKFRKDEFPTSQIKLIGDKNIEVVSNGSYYNPVSVLTNGYWALTEKIANMLPFDFKPSIQQIKKSK